MMRREKAASENLISRLEDIARRTLENIKEVEAGLVAQGRKNLHCQQADSLSHSYDRILTSFKARRSFLNINFLATTEGLEPRKQALAHLEGDTSYTKIG
jgi:hypothetical protein